MDAPEQIRSWLLQTMETKGWSARHWANAADVTPSTVQRALKEDYKFVTSSRTLAKLAKAAGVPPPDLSGTRGLGGGTAGEVRLPIRYEVAASGFLPRDELPQRPCGYRRVQAIRPFQDFTQWLERVVNESMNRIIPPGSLVHVVDAIEIGYAPNHDDVVVVERVRGNGWLVERTVKQVAMTSEGVELWPRSHNPRYQSPISLVGGAEPEEDVQVHIVGLVIRAYMNFAVAEVEDEEAA